MSRERDSANASRSLGVAIERGPRRSVLREPLVLPLAAFSREEKLANAAGSQNLMLGARSGMSQKGGDRPYGRHPWNARNRREAVIPDRGRGPPSWQGALSLGTVKPYYIVGYRSSTLTRRS